MAPFGAKELRRMNHAKMIGRAACALAVTALVGCSAAASSDSPAQKSTLSVSLMDAPVDGVTAVYVKITSMWIKPQGNGPAVQLPLTNAPLTVNLLELTDKNAAILIDEAVIEPGSYEWLAMDVAAERNVRDSYVMTETGGEEEIELRVPSGRVRLVGGFDVPPNESLQLLFDWDMRKGLVYPPGQGQYMLKPAFRMLDVTAYGVLQGTIAAATVGTSLDPAVEQLCFRRQGRSDRRQRRLRVRGRRDARRRRRHGRPGRDRRGEAQRGRRLRLSNAARAGHVHGRVQLRGRQRRSRKPTTTSLS